MPKKTDEINSRLLDTALSEDRFYTAANIDSVLATCPTSSSEDLRLAIEEMLEMAAGRYFLSCEWFNKTSPSEARKRFMDIEKSAAALLGKLELPESGDPNDISFDILHPLKLEATSTGKRIGGFNNYPPQVWEMIGETYPYYFGPEQLRDTIEGIKLIREWSKEAKLKAAELVSQNKKEKRKRNKGNEALSELIGELSIIWSEQLKQPIRTSVGNPETKFAGQATGPMIRFVQACLAPIEIYISNESVRDRIKVLKRKGKSGSEIT